MPQTDLLLANTDRVGLLHWTLEQGAVLVPAMHYHEPHYEEVRSAAKLEQFLSRRHFYVLKGDWQIEKLLMRPYVNKFKGAGFYIEQRYGGPSLSYLLYPQREHNGHAILGRGAIDYYPFYYSSSDGQQLTPNDSLKEFYAGATRLMKKGGFRIKGKQRSAWVACDGAKLLASKQAAAPEPWGDAAEDVDRS